MHVRPHLDYCDVIFHVPITTHDFDSSLSLNYQMNILEKTQYQAALAVSGCWKGTNTDKIYEELGWESLDQRRFFRRLVMFYKIINDLTPEYLKQPLPKSQCRTRSTDVNFIPYRTDRHSNSFYPNSILSWNNIGAELRNAKSIAIFKRNLLNIIRPAKKSIYNIHDTGIKWIFQLRVELSHLRAHKKRHNFADTPTDICKCLKSPETTQHFILECSLFDFHRSSINKLLENILFTRMENMSSAEKVHLLLYGDESFNIDEKRNIFTETIKFIRKTGRFSGETNNI